MSDFSINVRLLACSNCGAPLSVPSEGGQVTCEYCNVQLQIERRPKRSAMFTSPTGEITEEQRLASLQKQLDRYDGDSIYSTCVFPDELSHLDLKYDDPTLPMLAHQAFRRAVDACKAGGSLQQDRIVYWIANRIARTSMLKGENLKSRATLETALETVTDPGFIHMLHCDMSHEARKAEDIESAEDWLKPCDPRPVMLDLDTSFRMAKVSSLFMRAQYDQALELLGQDLENAPPISPNSIPQVTLMRVSALERSAQRNTRTFSEARCSYVPNPQPRPSACQGYS